MKRPPAIWINYGPPAQKWLVALSLILPPLIFGIMAGSAQLIVAAGSIIATAAILLFGGAAVLLLSALWVQVLVYCTDVRLRFDRVGVRFPGIMRLTVGDVAWRDLELIGFIPGPDSDLEKGKLLFFTADDSQEIDLRVMTDSDRLKIYEALVLWSKETKKDDDFPLFLDAVRHSHSIEATPSGLTKDSFANQKEISLKYCPKRRRVAWIITLLLFPIWGVIGTLGGLFFLVGLITGNIQVMLLLALFPMMAVVGIAAAASLVDTKLTVGQTGICMPSSLRRLGRRELVLWSEITKLQFLQRHGQVMEQGAVVLHCRLREPIVVELQGMSRIDIEKLLLAVTIWGQHIDQDAELRNLHQRLTDGKITVTSTHTDLWEAEMNRRFSSTIFVPLAAQHALQSGRLIVVKQIAFGGLSAIYQAQLNQTDLVVLKEFVVPDLDEQLQEKARELFMREAQILMKLSHPKIAKVRDCFVEAGRTYLVLDYLPGTDLRQVVMQKGPQPEATVIGWAHELAAIMAYLHEQAPPIMHRDLTPDNILVTADGDIRLIDFGAANEFMGTATGTLVGKQSFIAPEQFRGDTVPQSDIYSFGATLYYLLTGEEPPALSQSNPRLKNTALSEHIDSLVADCTAFDVEHRLPSAERLAERLCEAGRNTPVRIGSGI